MKVVIAATDYDRHSRVAWRLLVELSDKHCVPIVDHDGKILYDPGNGSDASRVESDVTDPARSRIHEGK
jgi:hypothetical protein